MIFPVWLFTSKEHKKEVGKETSKCIDTSLFYETTHTLILQNKLNQIYNAYTVLQNSIGDVKLVFYTNGAAQSCIITDLQIRQSNIDIIELYARQMLHNYDTWSEQND